MLPLRHLRLCFLSVVCLALTLGAEEIAATVPFELIHYKATVQVMVNGQGPFNFAIDTCTGGPAVVTAGLIEKLKLPVTGSDELSDPSGLNKHKVPVVRVDSIKLAGLEFKNLHASQMVEMHHGDVFDGILGFPLFRDYLLSLDFPGKQVTVSRGALPSADGDQVVPFRIDHEIPVVEMTIGGKQVDAHVDTGGMGLGVPQKLTEGLSFVSDPVVLGRGRTVSNEFEVKGGRLTSDVKLGGYTFSRPFIEINPLLPTVNLGAIPLRNFAVTFDQKNKRMRLVAAGKNIELAGPPHMAGPHGPGGAPASGSDSETH